MERTPLNIHFKQCETTYAQAFDKLVEDKIISTRGLKADAHVFCEFVFDVNTAYFEESGGYDFARDFFTEAYRMAVREVGDERYVLSAVMHADERNRALSDALGRDVYHYHLHVVYVPVVEKEIRWSKRCKDEQLRGTVKEVIQQVSCSKKWAFPEALDEKGNVILNEKGRPLRVPSYSLLQDRFYEHMKEAGFEGFERGEMGSTRVHLSDIDHKIQKDTARLKEIEERAAEQERILAEVNGRLTVARQAEQNFADLDRMGKRTLFGKIELPEQDFRTVIELAKEGVRSRGIIADLTRKLREANTMIDALNMAYNTLRKDTQAFFHAMKLAPQRVKALLSEISEKAREEREKAQEARWQMQKSQQRGERQGFSR